MIPNVIKKWHQLVETRNLTILDDILSDDVRLYSPVLHTVQQGKDITKMYLAGAAMILGNEHFRYVREVYDEAYAVLEFETELNGISVNGVDIISWDANDQITDFKVMIRPLKAVNAVHQLMAETLINLKK